MTSYYKSYIYIYGIIIKVNKVVKYYIISGFFTWRPNLNWNNCVLLALDVAMDEKAHRQEYLKKLTKFIDKDQVDSKGNNSTIIANQIEELTGFKPTNTSPEKIVQYIIYNADNIDFSSWSPSLKIGVRDLINKISITPGIEKSYKNILAKYDPSPEVQKFITWIKPLLIKKGLKLEPDEETEEN